MTFKLVYTNEAQSHLANTVITKINKKHVQLTIGHVLCK